MPSLPRPIERLANEFDLNLLMANGLWEVENPTNGPGAGTWFVQVYRSPLTLPDDLEATQLAYNKTTGRPKFRAADNGAWTDWIDAVAGGGSGGDIPQILQDIADILPNKGRLLVGTGDTWAAFDPAAFGDFLVADPDAPNGIDWFSMTDLGLELVTAIGASDVRTALGLVIGSNVQAYDDDLATIADFVKLKGTIIVADGLKWITLTPGAAGQYLTPNAGTASGYEWLDLPTVDLSNYFTKSESNSTFQASDPLLTDLTTLGMGSDSQILSTDGSTFKWIDTPAGVDLSNYYTKTQADAAFQPIAAILTALVSTGFGTNAQILSTDGSTFTWIDSPAGADLSNYYTKTEADAAFQAKGSYLVASDLTPYLTSADAATTYQPLGSYLVAADLDPYLTSTTAASTYQPIGSYLVAADLADYLKSADAASTYQPIGSYLVAADLAPYLTSANAATTYQPIDADLSAIAALAITKGNIIVGNGTSWTVLGIGSNSQVLVADSTQAAGVKWTDDIATVAFVIDGGGAAITPGIKGDVAINFAGTIVEATLLADQTGSIVVDIWKDVYVNFPPDNADSITSATPLTISSGTKVDDATLTSWNKTITAGDILRFNVDSASAMQRVTVILKIKKSH